jgi:hexaprenyl-diphosphate synthase
MGPLIARKFSDAGTILGLLLTYAQARELVRRSSGVQRTRELAQQHADKAREVLQALPDSEAKDALDVLAERVMTRAY